MTKRPVGTGRDMSDYFSQITDSSPMVTGEELAELLGHQHAELRSLLCRVPLLHDGAREDVFLRGRRLLAIHLGLEAVVLPPGLDGADDRDHLDEEIAAAEREGLESIDFDAALARLAIAFLRHVGMQGGVGPPARLSPRRGEAVAAAVGLWEGRGDAYLGNTWSEMVATVTAQLVSETDCASR